MIYLVLVNGFEWRFFSMQISDELMQSFQKQVVPEKPAVVYELSSRYQFHYQPDREIIIGAVDSIMQQAVVQQDNTRNFLNQFKEWLETKETNKQ